MKTIEGEPQVVRVFPDYCSSGLWDENGCNMWAEDFLGLLSESDLMALKYWHEAWEFLLMDGSLEEPPVQKMSDSYVARWSEDGKALVERFNKQQNEFTFIYEGDYWK